MKAAFTIACSFVLAVTLARGAGAGPSSPPLYTATDLGTIGGFYSNAAGINNHGQVVGQSNCAPGNWTQHAFLYDSTGMHDLGTLGGSFSAASAINDAGQVVGCSGITGDPLARHAFLYDSTGMHDLDPFGPPNRFAEQSWAVSINDAGQVVGTGIFVSPLTQVPGPGAFLWQKGLMQRLDVAADADSVSWAFAINASGQILGQVWNQVTRTSRMCLWQNGGTRELAPPSGHTLLVRALNNQGQMIGDLRRLGEENWHAMLYDDTGCHDLGTLGGAASGTWALNNLGQVVGNSQAGPSGSWHPFLYTGGAMYDIDKLLVAAAPWERFSPYGINDQGQIVGDGVWGEDTNDYQVHAFLLTPVAAPSLNLSASTLDFTGQMAGATRTVTLTNTGSAPLNIQGLSLAGPNAGSFQLANNAGAATLAPGASRTVAVTFTPAAVASRGAGIAAVPAAPVRHTAALLIRDNDPHPGSPHQVALTAVGTPPAAPTNLVVTVTAARQVSLVWTDNSNNETAFALWRQTGGSPFVRVGVVTPNRTRYTDTGLTPNTAYTYQVRATNNVGASAWSNKTTTVTLKAPPAGAAR
jgi:probable HAF family extracellular repeat protein